MDELTFAAILAVIIPPIASFLKSATWPAGLKMLLVGVLSLAVGAGAAVIAGTINLDGVHDVEGVLAATAIAFAESQVIYRLYFKGTTQGQRIDSALTYLPILHPEVALPSGETVKRRGPDTRGPRDA